jgi:hypothetical protein
MDIILLVLLFATVTGIVTFLLLLFYSYITKNSYIKTMIRKGEIHIQFPDPVDCMNALGYWKNGEVDTPESRAAQEMYVLIKKKFNIAMKIS